MLIRGSDRPSGRVFLVLVTGALVTGARPVRHWVPMFAASPLAVGIAAIPALTGVDLSPANHAMLLRICAVALALGSAFLLDDPAARTIATVPTSRMVRHCAQVTPGVLIAGVCWAAVLGVTRVGLAAPGWMILRVAGLSLEAAALVGFGLAFAAGWRWAMIEKPGVYAALTLLAAIAVIVLLPHSVTLFTDPTARSWTSAHRAWVALLVIAVLGFIAASLEPVYRFGYARQRPAPVDDKHTGGVDR